MVTTTYERFCHLSPLSPRIFGMGAKDNALFAAQTPAESIKFEKRPGLVVFVWQSQTRLPPLKVKPMQRLDLAPSLCGLGAHLGAHFEFRNQKPSIHAG